LQRLKKVGEMAQNPRPLRVLLAKPGLDGHDRGIKVVARILRDSGMEVVYLGMRSRVPEIARAAVQEDVDVIGLSILSGAHEVLVPELIGELKRQGLEIPVVVGGVIPRRDYTKLKEAGVAEIFDQEATSQEIVRRIKEIARKAS